MQRHWERTFPECRRGDYIIYDETTAASRGQQTTWTNKK